MYHYTPGCIVTPLDDKVILLVIVIVIAKMTAVSVHPWLYRYTLGLSKVISSVIAKMTAVRMPLRMYIGM